MGEVREGRGERVAALLDLRELRLHLLELGGDRLHPLDQLRGILARALSRRDRLGGLVLLRAPPLGLRQQLAAPGVEGEQLVELLCGAAATKAARAAAGSSRIARRSSTGSVCWIAPAYGDAGRSTSEPAYSATNSATACASSPTRMFWGMIAPEKPPLRMA